PLILFGLPDMAQEKTRYAIELPRLGGLILTHNWDGQIKGLKEFAPEDRPNAAIIFWTFRMMVGLGLLMIGLGLWSLLLRRGDRLYHSPLFLRAAICMGPAGLLALLAGWYTTEIGRQPWVVYGLMRTKDAVSAHTAGPLALTLGLFVIVYLFVFGVGVAYILRLVRKGPTPFAQQTSSMGGPGRDKQQMRPMSAADDKGDVGQSDNAGHGNESDRE
ncbi:MAG TPA: cytochrome ubiquinol oxidase subunit I, partial [Herbaspirillum sp.]